MRIFTKVSLSLKRTLVDKTDWQTLHSKYSSEEEVVLQHFAKDKLAMIPHQNQNGQVFHSEFGKVVGHRLHYFI